MTMHDPTADTLPPLRGRHWPWLFFTAALMLLGACALLGARAYAGLPDSVPTHWGADGLPDEFSAKSIGTVFMPLFIGAAVVVFLAFLAVVLGAMLPPAPEASAWKSIGRIAMIRSTAMLMGLIGLGIVTVVSDGFLAGIHGGISMPMWPLAIGSALLLPLALLLYWLGARWGRSRAAELGLAPSDAEAREDALWISGILYNDPADPAILVPQRSGMGSGSTINVGHRTGKFIAIGFVVIMSAFVLSMALVSS